MPFRSHPLVKFAASLRLAVVTMSLLALLLAAGTLAESRYNAEMARLLVYGKWYFRVILVLLAINVTMSVVVRWPLKRAQYGFGITHLGLLLLLAGAGTTQMLGLDGIVEIEEGKASTEIRMPEKVLQHYVDARLAEEREVPASLLPRQARLFGVPGVPGARVEEILPFVRPYRRLASSPNGTPVAEVALAAGPGEPTALQLGLDNPLLPARQDLGMLEVSLERVADSAAFCDTATVPRRTPLVLEIAHRADTVRFGRADLAAGARRSTGTLAVEILAFHPDARVDGDSLRSASDSLRNPAAKFRVRLGAPGGAERSFDEVLYARIPDFRLSGGASAGVSYRFPFSEAQAPSASPRLRLGAWRGTLLARLENAGRIELAAPVRQGDVLPLPLGILSLSVGTYLESGDLRDSAVAVEAAPGADLPPPALRLSAGPWGPARWLGFGSAVFWSDGKRRHALVFAQRRLTLPFPVRLDRFEIGRDPGTMNPAAYRSHVAVLDSNGAAVSRHVIAMNEPLKSGGFTLYQSSYVADPGKPAITVLSVNRDPGRFLKYLGSLVLVVGICWYVLARSRLARRKSLGEGEPPK